MKTIEDVILEAAFALHNSKHPAHVKKIAWHSEILIFPDMCSCLEEAKKVAKQQMNSIEALDNRDFYLLFINRIS